MKLFEFQDRGQKRHAPITFGSKSNDGGDETKKSRNGSDQRVYTPPSGKYSNKVQNYSHKNRSRGGFRGGNQGKNFRRY